MAESIEQRCVKAFKQCDHDEAVSLLPHDQVKVYAAAITTEFMLDDETEEISAGVTLQHLAAYHGWLDILKTMKGTPKYTFTCIDSDGRTPLHYASARNNLEVVKYLVTELGSNPLVVTTRKSLPLHVACFFGHIKVAKYFIAEQKCDPAKSQGYCGFGPLHYASYSQFGNKKIIEYLVTEASCGLATPDDDGNLPLHIASLNGRLNLVKCYIKRYKCDVASQGKNGYTLLHCASQGGHLDIIQYLITEGCDPKAVDNDNKTLIHIATCHGHIKVVEWLLDDGQIDIWAKDKSGKTCVDLTGKEKNHFQLLKLLKPFQELVKTSGDQISSFGKTILTGNDDSGKTTLVKVIINSRAASRLYWPFTNLVWSSKLDSVQKVEWSHIVGIVPLRLDSCEIGKMVLYDIAGHEKFNSSHSAFIQTVMQHSPATFINVIDLSIDTDEITKQLYFWLDFIDNATCKTRIKSNIIVLGSHADLLDNCKDQLESKLRHIAAIIERKVKRQKFIGTVAMDCRKINVSSATCKFITLLRESQQDITARTPPMSYFSRLLYYFLDSRKLAPFYMLKELQSLLHLSEDFAIISSQASFLTKLLMSLSDRSLINFFKNEKDIGRSWIVVDTDAALKGVHAIIKDVNEIQLKMPNVDMRTGIVRSSCLKSLLPCVQHFENNQLDMLVCFLQILELCKQVSLSDTNFQGTASSSPSYDSENHLFFPFLLNVISHKPLSKSFSFGWSLSCKDNEFFFPSHFLHVLLLRLVYTFPLQSDNEKRNFEFWINGIFWSDEEGIKTLVQVIDKQCIVVLIACSIESRELESKKHRSAVIKLVLDLYQQICPNVVTIECLISPLPNNWQADRKAVRIDDDKLFPIENIAKSLLSDRPYVLNKKGVSDHDFELSIKELQFEPYCQLSCSTVFELMDNGKADELVSQSLLCEVKTRCQLHYLEPQSHS